MADENNSVGSTSGGNVGGAFVSGLFNVGSGFLNNYFGKKASKKEYQRALDLWNIQNEYNKPVNQMARLREAGLNPNLVAGSLSNSVAGSIHAPSKENLSSPFENLDLVGSYQDLRQKDAQIQNIKAQTDLTNQQAKALRMENKENSDKGTSRGTPVVERNFKALLRIGEDIGNRLADYVVENDLKRKASKAVNIYSASAKSGFEHAIPFYGAYNKMKSYFK